MCELEDRDTEDLQPFIDTANLCLSVFTKKSTDNIMYH